MVHQTYNLFLALYLAHLLADFLIPRYLKRARKSGVQVHYPGHWIALYAGSLLIAAIMNPLLFLSWRFELAIIALSLTHLALDWVMMALARKRRTHDDIWGFAANQAARFAITGLAACIVIPPSWRAITAILESIRLAQSKFLLLAVVYIGVIFGGGYIIRMLISPLWKEKLGGNTETHDEVVNAGLYIGWLERFLALTAICLQSPSTVGLILTAKSIARYSELKADTRFVEYFLIGTLLSISLALVGGALLLKILYGTVSLGR